MMTSVCLLQYYDEYKILRKYNCIYTTNTILYSYKLHIKYSIYYKQYVVYHTYIFMKVKDGKRYTK